MVAKAGFENVIPWLEEERAKFREHLAAFQSGGLSLRSQLPNGTWTDDTPTYVAWVQSKINEFDDLIARHSLPDGETATLPPTAGRAE